jgi:hypothetical protein
LTRVLLDRFKLVGYEKAHFQFVGRAYTVL